MPNTISWRAMNPSDCTRPAVALVADDALVLPARERVRTGRADLKAPLACAARSPSARSAASSAPACAMSAHGDVAISSTDCDQLALDLPRGGSSPMIASISLARSSVPASRIISSSSTPTV